MAPEADSDLKRLQFVQQKGGQAINYTSDVAGKVYSTTKQYIPESLHPTVKRVEDTVSEYGSPVLTTVQDKGGKVLQVADDKVRPSGISTPPAYLVPAFAYAAPHVAVPITFRDAVGGWCSKDDCVFP